jgi:hypothetical protein
LDRHLDDAALASIWADASVAGAKPSHPHLEVCAACRSRFSGFTSWLEELRTDANAEAEEAFPADRLAAQHAQIFRRLEAAGRPARVIKFPRFARPLASSTSPMRRWVATAAAAGLIVGLGLGQLMDFRHPVGSPNLPVGPVLNSDRSSDAIQSASATSSDAAFMAAVDVSVTHTAVDELRAYDAFTPRAPFFDERR